MPVAIPAMNDPAGWLSYLKPVLLKEAAKLKVYNDEYELQSTRSYMHPELLAELGERIQQVVIAWPQLVVDAVEERLDPLGFRLPQGDPDDEMWRVWQANNLVEESQLGRLDALIMKRSYLCVGTNEADADTPLVTVESPLEVFADINPRDRSVRAAIRYFQEPSTDSRVREEFATIYLPNMTARFDVVDGQWKEVDRDEHNLGQVPVVPLVNRARVADRYGQSEIAPILPLSRGANKLATDMMVAAEFLAIPLRGLFGVGPGDIQDAEGNPLTALQAILGRLLTIPDDAGTAKMFEFAAAKLANFNDAINQLAAMTASIAGLPQDYLGLKTDNPPSAESRLAGEIRLIKRAERKQVPFGGSYEDTQRLVRRFQTGDWDPELARLETIWRNAATPTVAQTADAAVKKRAQKITSQRQAQEDCGYTNAQITRMTQDLEEEARRDPVAQLIRQPNPADGNAGA